ncbi:MAG TPA: 1,4-dihydroxy-2-naphthoate polyprenyltransferase [Bacteroidales bacterium]|nr:1,4-dihydroxy-2-naphthoate polyprenyltransferase [Bacteroidales bacterium]
MTKLNVWIKAFRLRTLPLALSSAILGSFLAYAQGTFKLPILILATLTTLFLQILSNLANDYGDALKGTDSEQRIGPQRVTTSGLVTKREMRIMIGIFIAFSLASGSLLIFTGLNSIGWKTILFFFILGLSAIYAAVKYTIGKNPYGYIGLGDVFVFIYFGIVGVAGTYFLHTESFDPWILLPASAIGLLSSGVLNLNNMRDIENDTRSGKRTLVVFIGSKAAKYYHLALITLSMAFSVIYTIVKFDSAFQLLFILTCPLFAINVIVVMKNTNPVELNPELKKLAFSTFVFSLTFGIGLILK